MTTERGRDRTYVQVREVLEKQIDRLVVAARDERPLGFRKTKVIRAGLVLRTAISHLRDATDGDPAFARE